jgi:hypothetical protein
MDKAILDGLKSCHDTVGVIMTLTELMGDMNSAPSMVRLKESFMINYEADDYTDCTLPYFFYMYDMMMVSSID